MKKGELDDAKRRALKIFDKWNDFVSCIPKGSGYYYELQGVIEDAVTCGAQAALKVHEVLESEMGSTYGMEESLEEQVASLQKRADLVGSKLKELLNILGEIR